MTDDPTARYAPVPAPGPYPPFPLPRWRANFRFSLLLPSFLRRMDDATLRAIDPGPPPADLGPQLALVKARMANIDKDPDPLGPAQGSNSPDRRQRIQDQTKELADLLLPFGRKNTYLKDHAPAVWSLCHASIEASRPVLMHLKQKYNIPRPDQIGLGQTPLVANPGHPAYPSGHTCQHLLAALSLESIIRPVANPADAELDRKLRAMFDRAHDAAINREYAGVHFPCDTEAGQRLARALFPIFRGAFAELFFVAGAEWTGLGARPDGSTPVAPVERRLFLDAPDEVNAVLRF